MNFADFADYWAPYAGSDGPYAKFVFELDEPERTTLQRHVQAA